MLPQPTIWKIASYKDLGPTPHQGGSACRPPNKITLVVSAEVVCDGASHPPLVSAEKK